MTRTSILSLPFPFQSTPPARGATDSATDWMSATVFQSTPPARGATVPCACLIGAVTISIHAPREGGDLGAEHDLCPLLHISIHAPREGGDSKDAQFYLRIFDK